MDKNDTMEKSKKFCPLIAFDVFLGGKYKLRILWDLRNGERRYGELKSSLVFNNRGVSITPRILSRELKQLAELKLIKRKQYDVVPPRVDYSLTARGERLIPLLTAIGEWGFKEMATGEWFPFTKPA
jgi:DNA-binding HxlR family transcriptional regulator